MSAPFHQRLVSIAAAVRVGALDEADCLQIADAFDAIAHGVPADAAFGLKLRPGQHRSAAAIAARDNLLRETAQRFFPDACTAEAARRLATALAVYRAGRWRRDCAADACPYADDALPNYLWRILRHRDYAVSKRRVRAILSASPRF